MQVPHRPGSDKARHRVTPESDDELRVEHGDLALGIDIARGQFVGEWIAIAGRTAADNVGNEHVLAPQAYAAQHLGQHLTGSPDERPTLLGLVEARTLADEHDLGFGAALTWHGHRASFTELAHAAYADVRADRFKRLDHGLRASLPGLVRSGTYGRPTFRHPCR